MKRIVILFCVSLLTVILCSSQNTYPKILNDSLIVITNDQLKQTNLIFVEHSKFKEENRELYNQLSNYNALIDNYKQIDSLQIGEIKELKIRNDNLEKMYNEKIRSVTKKKNYIIAGSGLLNIILLLVAIL